MLSLLCTRLRATLAAFGVMRSLAPTTTRTGMAETALHAADTSDGGAPLEALPTCGAGSGISCTQPYCMGDQRAGVPMISLPGKLARPKQAVYAAALPKRMSSYRPVLDQQSCIWCGTI